MNDDFGVYSAPSNAYEIPVPLGWTLKHDGESLELISPSGEAAVVVTHYVKRSKTAETDARIHLKRFLDGQDIKGKARESVATPKRASADFTDRSGKRWTVMFSSGASGLLLATCTYSAAATGESEQAMEIIGKLGTTGG